MQSYLAHQKQASYHHLALIRFRTALPTVRRLIVESWCFWLCCYFIRSCPSSFRYFSYLHRGSHILSSVDWCINVVVVSFFPSVDCCIDVVANPYPSYSLHTAVLLSHSNGSRRLVDFCSKIIISHNKCRRIISSTRRT